MQIVLKEDIKSFLNLVFIHNEIIHSELISKAETLSETIERNITVDTTMYCKYLVLVNMQRCEFFEKLILGLTK
jgi:hypothetical protein